MDVGTRGPSHEFFDVYLNVADEEKIIFLCGMRLFVAIELAREMFNVNSCKGAIIVDSRCVWPHHYLWL